MNNKQHIHHSSGKIQKIKVPSYHLPRESFQLPKTNRYFNQILKAKSPLKDMTLNETQDGLTPLKLCKKSSSFHHSFQLNKRPQSSTSIPLQFKSLPKVTKKRPGSFVYNDKMIYMSELRSFKYQQIVNKLNKLHQKDNQIDLLQQTVLRKMHSFGSQEQQPQQPIQVIKKEEERPYDQYDKYLMEKQPIYYKEKHFRLRHKIQWVYTK